jgi:hypothetical protein
MKLSAQQIAVLDELTGNVEVIEVEETNLRHAHSDVQTVLLRACNADDVLIDAFGNAVRMVGTEFEVVETKYTPVIDEQPCAAAVAR